MLQKKKFGNSFGNRTVILAKMKENAELVNVFQAAERDAGFGSKIKESVVPFIHP